MQKLELNGKLAKEIVAAALSGNPSKRVITFFSEFHPLGYDFDKFSYGKFKDNKVELQKHLCLDFLFYTFVASNSLILEKIRGLYYCYVQKADYYSTLYSSSAIREYVQRLNHIISFREYIAEELFKIIGKPKKVILKLTIKDYRSYRKAIGEYVTYGEDREAISRVLGNKVREDKIHSAKIYPYNSWNKYDFPFCKHYKELIDKYRVESAIVFDEEALKKL
jgi:hypothetical protein